MADWTDFLQRVKSANDIVDVIGSYIDVSQRGSSFWARCPFHGEKTPSFSISRKGFYKCFGCGESGDVISFVEKYEAVTFMEAVEILAKRANIEMPTTGKSDDFRQLEDKKKLKDQQYTLLREAGVYYYRNYYGDAGVIARRYMESRGFSADIIKQFGIGYSPGAFGLVDYLRSKGCDLDMAVKLGVLNSRNGKYYDAMSNRLVVPIINIYNKVIAFGGRALDDKTMQYGKYKNTSESPAFVKTNNLYAINMVKKAKQNANLPYIIMVEGYMDVIAMAQAGYMQCVASMGTSLTQSQAKLLSRLIDKVYICYDGDGAGQKATIRGLDILAREGLEVLVMSVPEGLDPDEYIGRYGKDSYQQLLLEALPLVDYKLDYLTKFFHIGEGTTEQNNQAIAKYANACLKLLSEMDDVTQQRYIGVVASKSGYTVEFIKSKLATNSSIAPPVQVSDSDNVYFHIASCMLSSSRYTVPESMPYSHSQPLNDILQYIWQCNSDNKVPAIDMIYTIAPAQEQAFYNMLLAMQDIEPNDNSIMYYNDCIVQLRLQQLTSDRKELSHQLVSQDAGSEQFSQITQKIQLIDDQINSLLND